MIQFNRPCVIGKERKYIVDLVNNIELQSNGVFTKKCEKFLEKRYGFRNVLLTSSCTSALEMCALLLNKVLSPNKKEILMPSYTFVSSANAFLKYGFKVKFVDIKPNTMNISEDLVEKAITANTGAILIVNYGGISCDIASIQKVCKKAKLYLVEDAAQSIEAKYKNKFLGSFADLACFSFHETKNITSGGEGGALVVNNSRFLKDAKIIREKGTNRSEFLDGKVNKYTWVGFGGNYLMNELGAAYLYAQLENINKITKKKLTIWNKYYKYLKPLEEKGFIKLQYIPTYSKENAHMFYIKLKTEKQRIQLIDFLKKQDIIAVSHYVPLHSSSMGKKYCKFYGRDVYTTKESSRILRLPLFYGLKDKEVKKVISTVKKFFTVATN